MHVWTVDLCSWCVLSPTVGKEAKAPQVQHARGSTPQPSSVWCSAFCVTALAKVRADRMPEGLPPHALESCSADHTLGTVSRRRHLADRDALDPLAEVFIGVCLQLQDRAEEARK